MYNTDSMRHLILLLLVVVFAAGCKPKRMGENGPPPIDGVIKKTIFSPEHGDLTVEEYWVRKKLVHSTWYYGNGNKYTEEFYFDNDTLRSRYIRYFPDGNLQSRVDYWGGEHGNEEMYEERYYNNGRLLAKTGTATDRNELYYEDGKPWTLVVFMNRDKREEHYWHSNGRHLDESYWKNGKRHGKWIQRDSTGTVTRNEVYRNGIKLN